MKRRINIITMRVVLLLTVYCSLVYSTCVFHADDAHNKDAEEKMKKWDAYGKNFTVKRDEFTYSMGICSSSIDSTNNTAIIQKEDNNNYVLGKLDNANLVGGDNWILLTYENGDRYINDCDNATRSASIIFVCGQNKSNLTILQVHTNKDPHCNYMFQLQVPEMCSAVVAQSNKLSGGAIFIIIISSLATVYLVAGALFMHIKRGARGIDHIPNLEMWRKLGHLSADGCDFCCRCNPTTQRAGYFLDESTVDMHGDDDILSP